MGVRNVVFVAMVLAAPLAAAEDPFQPICEGSTCTGFNTCVLIPVPGVPGLAVCIPPGCYPVAECHGEVSDGAAFCAVNATISGRTCSSTFGVGADGDAFLVPQVGPVGPSSVWVGASVTNGSVDRFNLENSWFTPTVEADAELAGTDLGRTTVGVYRSDILTEGPRGGPYGMIAPSQNHTWSQISVVASNNGGMSGSEDVQVSVWLLDYMPDGCHVRSPSGKGPEFQCPPLHDLFVLP